MHQKDQCTNKTPKNKYSEYMFDFSFNERRNFRSRKNQREDKNRKFYLQIKQTRVDVAGIDQAEQIAKIEYRKGEHFKSGPFFEKQRNRF